MIGVDFNVVDLALVLTFLQFSELSLICRLAQLLSIWNVNAVLYLLSLDSLSVFQKHHLVEIVLLFEGSFRSTQPILCLDNAGFVIVSISDLVKYFLGGLNLIVHKVVPGHQRLNGLLPRFLECLLA